MDLVAELVVFGDAIPNELPFTVHAEPARD